MSLRKGLWRAGFGITPYPGTDVTYEAECTAYTCEWMMSVGNDEAGVNTACKRHALETGHSVFRRIRTSFVLVVRDEYV